MLVEHNPCDESNRIREQSSSCHGFAGNFTLSEERRQSSRVHVDNEPESEREIFEERRLLLIDHHSLVHHNRSLQCKVR